MMTEAEEHDLMTIEETARYLRCHMQGVYRSVRRGQLPALRVGRCWRISKAALTQLAAAHVMHEGGQ